jgi:hypothetical protein
MRTFLAIVSILLFAMPAIVSLTNRVKKEAKRLGRAIAGWQVWVVNLIVSEVAALTLVYLRSLDGLAPPLGVALLAGAFVGLTASGLIDASKLIGSAALPSDTADYALKDHGAIKRE